MTSTHTWWRMAGAGGGVGYQRGTLHPGVPLATLLAMRASSLGANHG